MIRSVMVVAGCSLVFLAGCRDNGVKPPRAGIQDVWMQIDGMSERLKIIWLDWRNEIQEALSGLPGVRSAKQLEDPDAGPLDIIHIQYDPSKVSVETLLQTAEQHPEKLKAKMVPAPKKE